MIEANVNKILVRRDGHDTLEDAAEMKDAYTAMLGKLLKADVTVEIVKDEFFGALDRGEVELLQVLCYRLNDGNVPHRTHHFVDQTYHQFIHEQVIVHLMKELVQNQLMQVFQFRAGMDQYGMNVVVIEKPPGFFAVIVLQRFVKCIGEIEYRTDVGLVIDMACYMFEGRFTNERAPDVHFIVIAENLVFKETFAYKANGEDTVVFRFRNGAACTIAMIIADAVKV